MEEEIVLSAWIIWIVDKLFYEAQVASLTFFGVYGKMVILWKKIILRGKSRYREQLLNGEMFMELTRSIFVCICSYVMDFACFSDPPTGYILSQSSAVHLEVHED